jgi:hypothetical protein
MITIGDLKKLGCKVVNGDLIHGRTKDVNSKPMSPFFIGMGHMHPSWTIASFAWRAMDTLPDTARFKIEYNERGTAWRPLLDQSAVTEQDLMTLDVPFGELDRDTQLRLVNHVLDGGSVDLKHRDEWCVSSVVGLRFKLTNKYRAVAKQPKQPTELETLKAKLDEQWLAVHATIEQMNGIK